MQWDELCVDELTIAWAEEKKVYCHLENQEDCSWALRRVTNFTKIKWAFLW